MHLRLSAILAVILPAIISLPAENRYGSALLRHLSEAAGLTAITDTLPDGVYYNLKYKDKPVKVIIGNRTVTHIGMALFPVDRHGSLPLAAVNFVERYMLQAETGVYRAIDFSRQMEEDGVKFSKGDYHKLTQWLPDTSTSLSLDNEENRKYSILLSKDNKPLCALTFPVDYSLLLGADIGELELALVQELHALSCNDTIGSETTSNIRGVMKKLSIPDFYVERGSVFPLYELNNNRYYRHLGNEEYELIFSKNHPEWSLANLFTTNSIQNNISVDVKVMMYDLSTAEVSMPLSSLLQYFRNSGFDTYWGMIDMNESVYESEIILDNREYGFCHVMRMTGNSDMISTRSDTMKARMNCFIPVSKINTLFEEKVQ